MKSLKIALLVVLLAGVPRLSLAAKADEGELDCFIDPYMTVNLGSEVTGVLESIEVDRGDFVAKGQVLARIDTRVEQATVNLIRTRAEQNATIEAKKARLEFAKREHDRRDEIYQKGILPFKDMDDAITGLQIAERDYEQAAEEKKIAGLELQQALAVVERRIIRSTVDGVVVQRFLAPGELVNENKPIMKLAQIDPLNVEVIAPVSLFGSIKQGSHAEVRPESPVNGTFVGTVKIVDRVIDAASGTFGVRIELPNKKFSIPAGLKCQVRFLKK